MILLIGLAVGVDYSMFYLRRKMEERDAGRSTEAALEFAAATSGRAVLVSGLTVMIAMAGMFLAGNAVFTSFAVGTMLVVAVAMLGSVTVLPAVLSKLGDNVEKGRVPFIGRAAPPQPRRVARVGLGPRPRARPARRLGRRVAGGILLALALPALRHAHDQPGRRGPAARPADHADLRPHPGRVPRRPAARARRGRRPSDVTAPDGPAGHQGAHGQAIATGQMSGPVTTSVSPNKHVAIVSIPMQGDGTDERVRRRARHAARRRRSPPRSAASHGAEANVTGMTAGSKDFNDTHERPRLPLVFAFVLGLAFLLLLVTFRSIVVPLKAIVLNLLSRRRRLRRAHLDLPGRPPRGRARASSRSAGSRPGCRCSCS